MNHITYRFTLDLAKHGSQTVLSGFKVGDTNRAIDVALSMNGEPYYLGADQAAQLRAKYIGENEVIKQRYACEIKNGRVYCKIEPELLTAPGEIHLDLEVGDLDSDIFSTASFIIFAKGTVSNDEEIPAENYKSVITALANSENALKKSISTAEVDKSGNLVFTLFDKTQLDCGNVIGPQGLQGDKGDKGEKGDKGDVDHTALAEVRRYKFDYDGNGVVDINDANYLLYHIQKGAETYPIPSWCNADFNGDGVVNEDDAVDMMHAVNFPSQHPHLYDADAGTADYSIVANALKGKAIGEAVSMTDVSPLEHNIGVKLASKNIVDIKQMLNESLVDNGDGTFTYTRNASMVSASFPIKLKAGTKITSKAEIISSQNNTENSLCFRVTYADGGIKGYYLSDSKVTLEKDIVDILIYSYEPNVSFVFKEWQLELGTTATAYAPYVADISSVTLTKCGKNVFELNGYSATDKAEIISNNQGTTLSTTEAVNGVTITQTKYSNPTDLLHYDNGYFNIRLKEHLEKGRIYAFSCDIEILSNPLSSSGILLLQQGDGAGIGAIRIKNDSAFEVGKKYRISKDFEYHILSNIPDRKYFEFRNAGMSLILSNIQIELGKIATEYEPRIEPIPYTPKADGTVDGVTSLYPVTTLLTDTAGVTITAEYNRDINKAFADIYQKLSALGVAVVNN